MLSTFVKMTELQIPIVLILIGNKCYISHSCNLPLNCVDNVSTSDKRIFFYRCNSTDVLLKYGTFLLKHPA